MEIKMQITAIGCSLDEIILSCGGLLANAIKKGDNVNLVIANYKKVLNKNYTTKELEEKFGITINSIDEFDFSQVTQNNVKLIQNILEKYKPEKLIIPFNKSSKKENCILGSSSILAGRKIKNILMYELKKNTDFTPTIFHDIKNNYKIKNTMLYSLDKNKKSDFKKNIDTFNKNNKKFELKIKLFEPLQSFRMVLN
jgi:predicted metal-dependent hydrolase